jgi:hypothetical protein
VLKPKNPSHQLLATDNLTPEEWEKVRLIAKERVSHIADRALKDLEAALPDNIHSTRRIV